MTSSLGSSYPAAIAREGPRAALLCPLGTGEAWSSILAPLLALGRGAPTAGPGQHLGCGSRCGFDPLPIPDLLVDGCRGLLLRVLSLWHLKQNFCEQMQHCEVYINAALHLFAI